MKGREGLEGDELGGEKEIVKEGVGKMLEWIV